MRGVLQIGCLLLVGSAVVLGQARKGDPTDAAARAAAVKLYQSLTEEQKKLAVKDFNDKERYAEVFPAAERPGLSYDKLTAEQKALIDDVVRYMTSEYGASRCLEVAKQTPDNRRYLNFFGVPDAKKPFAWRIAMHHLTLLYAEFGGEGANELGPILFGGNPVKTLWDDEDKLALELFGSLSADEAKSIQGKGNGASGAAIETNGVRIGDLGEKPRALARKLLEQRLAVLSADRRKVFEDLVKRDGGVDNLRVAFWGDARQSHHNGGKYHWKIGGPSVLCDWQTQGNDHIHMTVRGRVKS